MSVLALNNKRGWCEVGVVCEEQFVLLMSQIPGRNISINPDKATNPYAPDLLDGVVLADLKTQTTPFFKAGERYGIDPNVAVTYNRKDNERYKQLYPTLGLYFWIWRDAQNDYGVSVPALRTVRFTTADQVAEWITSGRAPEHTYARRVGDREGNALSSFVLDIDWMDEVVTYGVPA